VIHIFRFFPLKKDGNYFLQPEDTSYLDLWTSKWASFFSAFGNTQTTAVI